MTSKISHSLREFAESYSITAGRVSQRREWLASHKHWRPIRDSSDASSVAFTAIERKRFRSIAHTGGPRGASDGSWF